jgi:hypothetical protein
MVADSDLGEAGAAPFAGAVQELSVGAAGVVLLAAMVGVEDSLVVKGESQDAANGQADATPDRHVDPSWSVRRLGRRHGRRVDRRA